MRLDHFVLFNNHLSNNTGGHMAQNTLSNSLSNNTGDTMSNNALATPSITKSRGFGPSHSVWVDTQNNNLVGTGKRIYGRIQDTGCNYVIEGWNMNGEWVRVPCRRLIDAQMLLAKVMHKETFDILRTK
jgi:hypothetical protein